MVYTDRALNHMSASFQQVMRDISRTLKSVYGAQAAIVVPGSGTFGMEAVARQFATGRRCLVIRNGWFSYRWSQIFEAGRIPSEERVLKARPVEAGAQPFFAPPPVDEVVAAIREFKPEVVFAAHVGNGLRHHAARRLHPPGRGCRARSGRPVRPGLHRFGHDVGKHA